MIRKSGNRFSEKIMLHQKSMIRKSGNRFSEKIMLHQKDRAPNRFNLKPSRSDDRWPDRGARQVDDYREAMALTTSGVCTCSGRTPTAKRRPGMRCSAGIR